MSWLSATSELEELCPPEVELELLSSDLTELSTLDEELAVDSTELSTLSGTELSSGFSFEQPAKVKIQEIATHKICFFISSPSNEYIHIYYTTFSPYCQVKYDDQVEH